MSSVKVMQMDGVYIYFHELHNSFFFARQGENATSSPPQEILHSGLQVTQNKLNPTSSEISQFEFSWHRQG